MRKYMADDTGNCLQCCLAGIFDLPLERVPNIHTMAMNEGGWYDGLYVWCREKVSHIPVVVIDDTLDDLLHVEVVETLHGVTHAVVARGMELVHDPQSTAEYHENRETQYKILFVPVETGIQRRTPIEERDKDDTN